MQGYDSHVECCTGPGADSPPLRMAGQPSPQGPNGARDNTSNAQGNGGEEVEEKKKRGNARVLDLERMCGVLVPDRINPCMRSLSCKAHSNKLKRAVPGRSVKIPIICLNGSV